MWAGLRAPWKRGLNSLAQGRSIRWTGRGLVQRQQFLAENGHLTGSFDPQANLAPVDVHDRDANIFVDINLFAKFSAQNQHIATLLRASGDWFPAELYAI